MCVPYLFISMSFISNAGLECGKKPEETERRIVGGKFSDAGEWPWQVLLQWENGTEIYKRFNNISFCGGAILSRHFILTAAHCTLNGKFNNNLTTMLS